MEEKDPNTLVVYDIPDDRTRNKVADACLDYGLDRIQYSAFLGWLLPTQQDELFLKLTRILGKKEGNIQLFTFCSRDWKKHKTIEQKGKPK
ncbi:CRISPR-associated protein Cas2 [Spirochaeta thermophila DSM 6578]|uniref:CRISPR-associated endoribonuclease Cas2 n=1 Tax=Winmispira thermophila (strain ATCC 700085 / DSM 6578 / Z-1203) TaxID=869211 RepID=G0GAL0_WINT7|nr:CRISPR-associated endonuclease Cas2 [Spirochaeta thermophila]AEJ60975.1 CRISPR-associated protein Cas2 [Spirochaeta thermophila DSM 6578]